MVIFSNIPELKNKIAYYLNNETERKRICNNGYLKCSKKYSYSKIMRNILKLTSQKKIVNFSNEKSNYYKYLPPFVLRLYKFFLLSILQVFFSKEKALKFSRRLLFEIEWRVRGDKTYSFKGWCSNLFGHS